MYLESYNGRANTTLKSNVDFMISMPNKYSMERENKVDIIMCSLCDIAINVKGVISNFNAIDTEKIISIKSYDNIDFFQAVSNITRYNKEIPSWQYKISKNSKYTHGLIYNKNLIQNCIFDYDGNKKYEVLTKFINTKYHLPITVEILKKLDEQKDNKLFKQLNVFSKQPSSIKVYYLEKNDIELIEHMLTTIDIGLISEKSRWDSIATVNDYVIEFHNEIQEVLDKSIKVRFNQETDIPDMRMFDYKRKPYKGQVALVESAKRTLLDEQRVIITADMGAGKTTIGTMANDLYMQEKGKDKYVTLVVVPNATLKKWKAEIFIILGNKVNVEICTSTVEYIRLMNNYTFDKPLYIITSKETAKLGYKRKPAVRYSTKILKVNIGDKDYPTYEKTKITDLALCPDCGLPMINSAKNKKSEIVDEYLREKHFASIKKSNYKCPNCNSILWDVDKVKTAKTSLMDYCHRKNVKFDSVIFDEFHNEKNLVSATGQAFGQILQMSKIKILLSGTMNNGNVSSLFPLLMRLIPYKMFKDGYTMQDMEKFIHTYGSLKAVKSIKDDEQRMTSRTMFKDSDFREVAGINAIVYSKYLADITISATIDDLGIDMVKYTEHPYKIALDDEFNAIYHNIVSKLKETIPYNFQMYNSSVLRHYINNPFGWDSIIVNKPNHDGGTDEVEIKFPNLEPSVILSKERALIQFVKDNLSIGKKCLVFTDFTGGHSRYQKGEVIDDRLARILKEQGINSKTLKASIKPIDRMEYINKHSEVEVWITNPILVKEGLDLIDFPAILFYSYDYEVMKINQASRRAWRPTQTTDCTTSFLYYENSVEEKIMKSVTLKKVEMGAIEGKFSIDDFSIVKRTASTLGKTLYDAINVDDSLNKLNQYQITAKNVKLHPVVEELYK